jgi:hypothetical protein
MRRTALVSVVAALVASACSSPPSAQQGASPTSPIARPSLSPTLAGTPPVRVARLASGEVVPSTCSPGNPSGSDTAAFVVAGHAWALSPDGTRLTCLFDVPDPGPFDWGPLGDRALVGGFEVKGLPGAFTLPPSDVRSGSTSWGRPTGRSIVIVTADGSDLEKVHLDGDPLEAITPLKAARYLSVTYHPSGLALAFAVERSGGQSIWISSNTGKSPKRLVFSKEGTKFGDVAFSSDGVVLYYVALHANGTSVLHDLSLVNPTEVGALASAPPGKQILGINPGLVAGTIAWTTGTSCDSSVAMARDAEGNDLTVPGGSRPTSVLGWLDADRILVATGGCSGPMDLSSVEVSTGTSTPLVFGVDAAGVRTPAPTPPPPLPKADADVGSGNA